LQLLDPSTSTGGSLQMILDAVPPVLTGIINLADILIGHFQLAQGAAMGFANGAIQAAAAADRAMAAIVPGKEVNAELQAFAADYERQLAEMEKSAKQHLERGWNGGAQQDIASVRADAKAAVDAAEAARKANQAAGAQAEVGAIDSVTKAQQSLSQQIDRTTAAMREQVNVFDQPQALPGPAIDPLAITMAPVTDTGMLDEFEAFAAANGQLANSLSQVRDQLSEQIEYWGMDADAVELAKLAKQGATQQELDELRTLQAKLKELQVQKESAGHGPVSAAGDVTIGARSMSDPGVYDDMRAARERAADLTTVDRYAGIGEPVPVNLPPPTDVPALAADVQASWSPLPAPPLPMAIPADIEASWGDILGPPDVPAMTASMGRELLTASTVDMAAVAADPQVALLERIAKGIEAWAEKEGITVEEVRI
jgi:hypothetical protein